MKQKTGCGGLTEEDCVPWALCQRLGGEKRGRGKQWQWGRREEWGSRDTVKRASLGREKVSRMVATFKFRPTSSLVNLIDRSLLLFSLSHLCSFHWAYPKLDMLCPSSSISPDLTLHAPFHNSVSLLSYQIFLTAIWKYHSFICFFLFTHLSVFVPAQLWSNLSLVSFFCSPVHLFSSPFLQ